MPDGADPRAVLVIGAGGVLGVALVRAFEDAGWQVVQGTRRGNGAPGARMVDLDRPDTVAAAIVGVDLIVDTVPHPGLIPERAVLCEGGLLIDVSVRPAATGQSLRRETDDARGTVVLNAGRTPGVSNLVVAELFEANPDADEVEIVFSFSASGVSGRAGGEFVHGHLTSARRHRTAVIPFPAPLGPTRCLRFAESEDGWLGDLAGRRTVATYARFSPTALNRTVLIVNALRLMTALPLDAFVPRRKEPADALSSEPVTEWVAVLRKGERLAARTITGAGNYRVTAAATLVLAEKLTNPARRDRVRPGCFEPQELFSLAELEADLRQRGLAVARAS
jgi:NAD(P)-dependent dehydrogenase (short-subunit alcohol dehydrogenase family)